MRTIEVPVPPAASALLIALSRQLSCTLSPVYMALIALHLGALNAVHDLVLGSLVSYRNSSSLLAKVVGNFVNVLPIRVRLSLSSSASFADLCSAVSETLLSAMEHSSVPLQSIVSRTAAGRDASRRDPFTTLFSYIDETDVPTNASKTLRELAVTAKSSKFELMVEVVARPSGTVIRFELDEGRADLCTHGIQHLVQAITQRFEHMRAEQFAQPLRDDRIWAGMNKDVLAMYRDVYAVDLAEFNPVLGLDGEVRFVDHGQVLLHDMFARSVERSPNNVAVIEVKQGQADVMYTYEDLAGMQQRVQRELLVHGVQESRKPILVRLSKSIGAIASWLGVLAGSCPFVPINASTPWSRIRRIARESGAALILSDTTADNDDDDGDSNVPVVIIDFAASPEYDDVQDVCVSPDRCEASDVAYMIYTSGSTGAPKGIIMHHRGAVNTIIDINERFEVSDADSLLAVSALAFDLSICDVFGVLAAGATLVLPTIH